MQLACLSSFAMHGHRVVLYSDNPKLNVPEFIDLQPAESIWSPLLDDGTAVPPVLASDIFRLKLFESQKTIWADTDAYCVAPFKFGRQHLFGRLDKKLATGVLRLPPSSPILSDMLSFAFQGADFPHWISMSRQKRAEEFNGLPPLQRLLEFHEIKAGILGPKALNYYAYKHQLMTKSFAEPVFYPLNPKQSAKLFKAGSMDVIDNPKTHSVHFYGRRVPAQYKNIKENLFPLGSYAHHAYNETAHLWEHLL